MIFVDLIAQTNHISSRNANFIHESWSNDCSWEMQTDLFCHGELQLILNTDGAPVFKSNKLSVWHLWVQLYNLPPLLRASYANICLLGLWHGESKPDLNYVLRSVSSELEILSKGTSNNHLRPVSFRFRSIVCDAPARAYVLCMKQHMGYESCSHCFIKGVHENRRMLFKLTKAFFARKNQHLIRCAELAEEQKGVMHGIKSKTPLNIFLLAMGLYHRPDASSFSWNRKSSLKNFGISNKRPFACRFGKTDFFMHDSFWHPASPAWN